jgi:hypothetical protein
LPPAAVGAIKEAARLKRMSLHGIAGRCNPYTIL